jgi:hypothetical protein
VGAGDAVVPAEALLVEDAPEKTESERKSGEKRG